MRSWIALLAGPLIWTAHFGFIYAIASIDALDAGAGWARTPIAVSGLVAALGALLVCARLVLRREGTQTEMFARQAGSIGAFISAIAIVWQTLPALAL